MRRFEPLSSAQISFAIPPLRLMNITAAFPELTSMPGQSRASMESLKYPHCMSCGTSVIFRILNSGFTASPPESHELRGHRRGREFRRGAAEGDDGIANRDPDFTGSDSSRMRLIFCILPVPRSAFLHEALRDADNPDGIRNNICRQRFCRRTAAEDLF